MSTLRTYFDAETVAMLRSVLEESWSRLQPHQQRATQKTELATRILMAAGNGERDPSRLRARALQTETLAEFAL